MGTNKDRRDHLQLAYNGLCSVMHELDLADCSFFRARADQLRDDVAHHPDSGYFAASPDTQEDE